MISAEKLAENLQRTLDFKEHQIATLTRENFLLKRAVKRFLQTHLLPVPEEISLEVPDEPEASWAEKAKRFKPLLHAIMEVVDNFVKANGQPAHYDDIIYAVKNHAKYRPIYESIHSDPHGTITARCRDLRKWGYLESPEEAHFVPGPKRLKP
jgi:hypothetical protein